MSTFKPFCLVANAQLVISLFQQPQTLQLSQKQILNSASQI